MNATFSPVFAFTILYGGKSGLFVLVSMTLRGWVPRRVATTRARSRRASPFRRLGARARQAVGGAAARHRTPPRPASGRSRANGSVSPRASAPTRLRARSEESVCGCSHALPRLALREESTKPVRRWQGKRAGGEQGASRGDATPIDPDLDVLGYRVGVRLPAIGSTSSQETESTAKRSRRPHTNWRKDHGFRDPLRRDVRRLAWSAKRCARVAAPQSRQRRRHHHARHAHKQPLVRVGEPAFSGRLSDRFR
jgi:hypothetical protein